MAIVSVSAEILPIHVYLEAYTVVLIVFATQNLGILDIFLILLLFLFLFYLWATGKRCWSSKRYENDVLVAGKCILKCDPHIWASGT